MNYTSPNQDHEDSPEDWLYTSLLFTRTLGKIIDEGCGIVIEPKGDMLELRPKLQKVIVHSTGNKISVVDINERTDLKEGDWIKMIDETSIMN